MRARLKIHFYCNTGTEACIDEDFSTKKAVAVRRLPTQIKYCVLFFPAQSVPATSLRSETLGNPPGRPAPDLGSLGQKPLKFIDQRLLLLRGIQHPVVGCYRILNFEQGAHIPSIAGHTSVVEDLPGVVVGDSVALNPGGVVNKCHSVSVYLTGNISISTSAFRVQAI